MVSANVTVPMLKVGDVVVTTGRYGPHTWSQTMGITAPSIVWKFAVAEASKILAGPQETTIVMRDANGVTKTIQRVRVVGESFSPDALVRSIIFSDVRYDLTYAWVFGVYNQVIFSGTLRQVTPEGLAAPNTAPYVATNLIFQPSSLKGSDDGRSAVPWNANEIALDVIQKATTGHSFQPIAFRNLARPRTSFIPNNVRVDMAADMAIGAVLGPLGGLDLRVADDGALELVDAFLGAEKSLIDPIVAAYSLEEKSVLRWISMANVCPQSAKVLYKRRCEIRADSWEVEPASDLLEGDDLTWGFDNSPTMINVGLVTDPNLPLADGTNAVMGTLLPMDTLITSIAALADQPPTAPPLSRQFLLAGGGGNNGIGNVSALLGGKLWMFYEQDFGTGVGPTLKWVARDGMLKNYFRQVYKLNPVLARQCQPGSIKAERVGLLDAATATRQPATVYMDYVERPKNRGISSTTEFGFNVNAVPGLAGNQQEYVTGIKSYSDPGLYNVNPFPLSSAQAAPFNVSVEDSTTGVFRFSPRLQDTSKLMHDAEFFAGLVWRCPVVSGNTILRNETAIGFWEQGQMLLTHRVALVFSAVPGGPNASRALHAYPVALSDALSRLGAPSSAVHARAAVREMRVRDGVAMALIPWDDTPSVRQAILSCFNDVPHGGFSDPANLVPVNDQQLRDYATSVFSVYVATQLDHYEGEMNVGFMPNTAPIGSLQQVQHTFLPDGKIYTTLRANGVTPPPSYDSLISQSSRNILFGGISA